MATTSQILGWAPQEPSAAAFTAAGEAGPGNDLGGVLQTIMARRALNPKSNIVALVTAPQQFVANDRYTPQQVADPNFGRKVYGNRYYQALATVENPNLMSGYLQAGQGATSFRGQALIKNKLPGDIMFDKLGNFFFDKKPQVANQLIQALGQPAPLGLASGSQLPVQQQSGQITPQDLLAQYTNNLIQQSMTTFDPIKLAAETQQILNQQPTDYLGPAADQEDKLYGIRPLMGPTIG